MEMMKTWCSEVNLNLESLFRCTYVNEILVSYFIDKKFWPKMHIKTKKNKINYFNFVLYYQIIKKIYFCVKTENTKSFYCISWKFCTKKIEK